MAHDCSLTFPSLSLLVGLTFQAEVIQETSLTTIAGEKVTLICGSSAGVVTTSNYADWVQRKPYQGRLVTTLTETQVSSSCSPVPSLEASLRLPSQEPSLKRKHFTTVQPGSRITTTVTAQQKSDT